MPIKAKYNKDSKSFDSLDFDIEKQIKQQLEESFKPADSNKPHIIRIDFNILFPPKFIKLYTNDKFSDINEFFGAVNIFTHDDLENIPQETIDNHITKYTKFHNLQDFLNNALSFKG
jgi:hypothetical protein